MQSSFAIMSQLLGQEKQKSDSVFVCLRTPMSVAGFVGFTWRFGLVSKSELRSRNASEWCLAIACF